MLIAWPFLILGRECSLQEGESRKKIDLDKEEIRRGRDRVERYKINQ